MELLRIALVGGLVGLDTTAAFQVMISQPLVGALLAGWALGDPWGGAFIGLLFQGLYLAEIPLGGRTFPDSNQGALQAAALSVYLQSHAGMSAGAALLIAFVWALPVSVLGGRIIVLERRLHAAYLPLLDRLAAADRRGALNMLYIAVIVENFLVNALLTAGLFGIGALLLGNPPVELVESALGAWGQSLQGGLLGAGCAAIFLLLATKSKKWRGALTIGAVIAGAGIWAAGF